MDGQKPLAIVQPASRISLSRFMSMQKLMCAGRMPPVAVPGSLVAKTGAVIHRMLELTIKGQLDHEQMIPLQWGKIISLKRYAAIAAGSPSAFFAAVRE